MSEVNLRLCGSCVICKQVSDVKVSMLQKAACDYGVTDEPEPEHAVPLQTI
jgi:hypothetical protein